MSQAREEVAEARVSLGLLPEPEKGKSLTDVPVVDDPDYLKQEHAELSRRPLNFDFIGLGVLSLVMAFWETLLSKRQEWGWLGDPFGRVQTLAALFVLGLGYLIYHELRGANPIINFRVLRERNRAIGCVIKFCAFASLYGASIALPRMLRALFAYDAFRAGLAMSPSGVSSLAAMVIVGLFAVLTAVLVVLVLLMKRSVAEPGEHIGRG